MDPLTRLVVMFMCVLTTSVGIANASKAPRGGVGVTTVTLRSTVRLAPDAGLTLGAIAAIEGDQASALADLPVGAYAVEPGKWTRIEAEAVRAAITDSPAYAGSIVVVGPGVSLTRLTTQPTAKPASASPAEGDPGVITVRDQLESWLRSRFRVAPDDIRISFDDRDREMLRTPTDGRVVSVAEIGFSGRIALRIEVFEGDHIVLSESARIGVEIRTEAMVVTRPVRRGSPLRETDIRRETVWTDPTDPPAPPPTSLGQSLVRSLQPGEIVRAHHLEIPVLIERGQDVSVRTVHGSVVVSTTARARGDARMGELIELESKDGSRRRFTARVAGPGRAVMAGGEPAEQQPADAPSVGADPSGEPPAPSATITVSEPGTATPADFPAMTPIKQRGPDMQPVRKTR